MFYLYLSVYTDNSVCVPGISAYNGIKQTPKSSLSELIKWDVLQAYNGGQLKEW